MAARWKRGRLPAGLNRYHVRRGRRVAWRGWLFLALVVGAVLVGVSLW